MDINDVIAERIEAARRRYEAERAHRERRRRARAAGLAQRHATKLRHLAGRRADLSTKAHTPTGER